MISWKSWCHESHDVLKVMMPCMSLCHDGLDVITPSTVHPHGVTQMTAWHKWHSDTNDTVTQMTQWHKWHIRHIRHWYKSHSDTNDVLEGTGLCIYDALVVYLFIDWLVANNSIERQSSKITTIWFTIVHCNSCKLSEIQILIRATTCWLTQAQVFIVNHIVVILDDH